MTVKLALSYDWLARHARFSRPSSAPGRRRPARRINCRNRHLSVVRRLERRILSRQHTQRNRRLCVSSLLHGRLRLPLGHVWWRRLACFIQPLFPAFSSIAPVSVHPSPASSARRPLRHIPRQSVLPAVSRAGPLHLAAPPEQPQDDSEKGDDDGYEDEVVVHERAATVLLLT